MKERILSVGTFGKTLLKEIDKAYDLAAFRSRLIYIRFCQAISCNCDELDSLIVSMESKYKEMKEDEYSVEIGRSDLNKMLKTYELMKYLE
jgi:hypothetical protein